jgi:hypothetical protein
LGFPPKYFGSYPKLSLQQIIYAKAQVGSAVQAVVETRENVIAGGRDERAPANREVNLLGVDWRYQRQDPQQTPNGHQLSHISLLQG